MQIFLWNLLQKMFYTKYFVRKLIAISYKFFFSTKFISISLKKKLKPNWQEIWVFLVVFEIMSNLKFEMKDGVSIYNSIYELFFTESNISKAKLY